MRHIHVHLHSHSSGATAQDAGTRAVTPTKPLSTKAPSTTPKRPPSTVIKPAPQAPHKPPRPGQAKVKPMKPAGVIKGQIAPRVAGAVNTATKGVGLAERAVRGINRFYAEHNE
jgi:hypothetical protein